MAGRKLTNATYNVSIDWQDECSSKNILKKGYYNLEFSEMGTTNIPIIQAGSSIDIDGVIYVFDTNENITGSIASGVNYVKAYDSSGTAIAEFTQVAPSTYDYLKGGYYNGVERYVMIFSSTGSDYSDKRIMNKGEALYLENDITINDIDIKGSIIDDLNVDGNLTVVGDISVPAYGAVGCLIVAASNSWARSNQYLSGTTVTGSSLYRSTSSPVAGAPLGAFDSVQTIIKNYAWTSLGLTGTWRLLTRVYQADATNGTNYVTGLLQRIS